MSSKEETNTTCSATENPLEESSVTMLDVLEQEKEMEEEYAAVLGASDEKCCTYAQGAVKRQALYACLTCCPQGREDLEKCAGVCLACSYHCHENHELVELYTKRNFRCDCPTERIGSNRCVLNPTLDGGQPRNADNLYNQNFQGVYCSCHRPYPDPERTTEEVMLQCAVCEDWFHLQHLEVPSSAAKLVDACAEMICANCMKRHIFLRDYTGLALKALEDANESQVNNGDQLICEDNDNKLRSDLDKSISEIMGGSGDTAANTQPKKHPEEVDEQKVLKAAITAAKQDSEEPECKRAKLTVDDKDIAAEAVEDASKCGRPTTKNEYEKGGTFWGADWRAALCRCVACMQMYQAQKVEFLIDGEDSAKCYEERGMRRAATETSTYEQGIRALASIGRVQQIDAITEYNRMKEKLMEYLQTFAVSKKVVTEEDINRFFAEMRNEKNAQVGQPFFCR